MGPKMNIDYTTGAVYMELPEAPGRGDIIGFVYELIQKKAPLQEFTERVWTKDASAD